MGHWETTSRLDARASSCCLWNANTWPSTSCIITAIAYRSLWASLRWFKTISESERQASYPTNALGKVRSSGCCPLQKVTFLQVREITILRNLEKKKIFSFLKVTRGCVCWLVGSKPSSLALEEAGTGWSRAGNQCGFGDKGEPLTSVHQMPLWPQKKRLSGPWSCPWERMALSCFVPALCPLK